jgi:hypothetical protein
LSGLGFVAQPRGNIGYRSDGRIIEAPLEADGAERGEAVRDADPEAYVVSPPTPRFGQRTDSFTHFERHKHSLKRWAVYRDRIVEDHHHAITGVPLKRTAVLDDDFADGCVIIAQKRNNVFRVGAFKEASEPAQITEERGYLPAMAFELLLSPGR